MHPNIIYGNIFSEDVSDLTWNYLMNIAFRIMVLAPALLFTTTPSCMVSAAWIESGVSLFKIPVRPTPYRVQDPIPEQRISLRGRVTWAQSFLEERLRIKLDNDSPKFLVLITKDGKIFPLLKDARGRAFYQDKRLREREVELNLRTWTGIPFVKVLNVYTIKKGTRYHVDYWCDVCAIRTFDIQLCPCCQDIFGPMRLREEPLP